MIEKNAQVDKENFSIDIFDGENDIIEEFVLDQQIDLFLKNISNDEIKRLETLSLQCNECNATQQKCLEQKQEMLMVLDNNIETISFLIKKHPNKKFCFLKVLLEKIMSI